MYVWESEAIKPSKHPDILCRKERGKKEKSNKKQLRTRVSLISSYNKTVETEKERGKVRERQSDIKTSRD